MNSYSIVVRVVNGSNSFLFTGDAQTDSEKEMLTKGYTLKCDVLKVGHHGSDTSTYPDFLKAVSPQYAVIEVGKGNDYGHPHQVTLDKLAAAKVQVYRTDLNGTIEIVSDGTNLNAISNGLFR
jgi:competence protein ComEC